MPGGYQGVPSLLRDLRSPLGNGLLGSPMLMKSDRYWHVSKFQKSLQNPVSIFMTCRESAITGRRRLSGHGGGAAMPLWRGRRTTRHIAPSSTGPVTSGTSVGVFQV